MTPHYRIDGPDHGLPLVLINGLFADLTSWDRAMPYLADCRVLRFDGRGQGRSQKPNGPYTLALLLEDLQRLLDALSFGPAHVVGISNGGCVALALAAESPERVLSVVAADCYAKVSPLLRLKIHSWLLAHEIGGPEHRFDVAAPWIWSETSLKVGADIVAGYRRKAADHEDVAVRGLLEGALTHHINLADIQVPTLLLAGTEDLLTPPFSMREMAEQIAKGRFEEVQGAHASLLEFPDIFREWIVPFIHSAQAVPAGGRFDVG